MLAAARMQGDFEIKHATPEHKANREIVLEPARMQEDLESMHATP